MKGLYLIALLSLLGCSSNQEPEIKENKYEKVDSAIQRSESNILKNDSVYRESEKIISEKVKQTIGKIQRLKEEILVTKANAATAKTIIKTDTVYIEKKKSFWGREKISMSIKEGLDTLDQN